jgi:uncharacterized protein (TIGR02757 family)
LITKTELDKLVKKYETVDFINDDPIQFCHRYVKKEEIELAGFIASLFAYGNRKLFIKKLDYIFKKTNDDLIGFIKNGDFSNLQGIEYRFSKDNDIIPIFEILSKLYNESRGLEELFEYGWIQSTPIEMEQIFLQTVVDYFYSNAPRTVTQGFYHMLPNPQNGGAMKRMNMFLRWMVRKGPVDLGIWDFMQPKDLLIPLDVHVARISREMKLLIRKSNDFKSVLELTNNLKRFSFDDPIKYDFALFGFGVQ